MCALLWCRLRNRRTIIERLANRPSILYKLATACQQMSREPLPDGSLRRHRQPGRRTASRPQIHARFAASAGRSARVRARCWWPMDEFAARRAKLLRGGRQRRERDAAVQDRGVPLCRRRRARGRGSRVPRISSRARGSHIEADNTDGAGLVADLTAQPRPRAARRARAAARCRRRRAWRDRAAARARARRALVIANRTLGALRDALARAFAALRHGAGVRARRDCGPAPSTWSSTRPRPRPEASPSRCRVECSAPGSSPTTWRTGIRAARSSRARAPPARAPATASACWSSRPRNRSGCGAAGGPTPPPVLAALRARFAMKALLRFIGLARARAGGDLPRDPALLPRARLVVEGPQSRYHRVHGGAASSACASEEPAGEAAPRVGAVRADLAAPEARDRRRRGRALRRARGLRLGSDREGDGRRIARRARWSRGGSTISQQLAKNLFLSASRTLWRKGQEALITVMIEQLWTSGASSRST